MPPAATVAPRATAYNMGPPHNATPAGVHLHSWPLHQLESLLAAYGY